MRHTPLLSTVIGCWQLLGVASTSTLVRHCPYASNLIENQLIQGFLSVLTLLPLVLSHTATTSMFVDIHSPSSSASIIEFLLSDDGSDALGVREGVS